VSYERFTSTADYAADRVGADSDCHCRAACAFVLDGGSRLSCGTNAGGAFDSDGGLERISGLFWVSFFSGEHWLALTWSSMDAESVDNFTPALAISMSWLPYVLFYGPVFLLMKSTDRVRASCSMSTYEESQNV